LVSSVMFFSFSSAMVMIHLNPLTQTCRFSVFGRFSKEGIQGRKYKAGKQGCFTQPAVVPQQNFPVPTIRLAAPRLQFGLTHHSLFPGFWCSADGTCAWPSRQAGTAYNDSVMSVKRQIHDQSACVSFPSLIRIKIRLRLYSPSSRFKRRKTLQTADSTEIV
jgi:hypothetical protein